MTMTILPAETPIRPISAEPTDVIVRNPREYAEVGKWTVTAYPKSDGWVTTVEYSQADGSTGVFRLEPGVWLWITPREMRRAA